MFMQIPRIAAVQFEHRSGDKKYNLAAMKAFAENAAAQGADIIAFHECCISGYGFARHLKRDELFAIAEFVPDGESCRTLRDMAEKHQLVICAGLFERDKDERIYNSYVCVDKNGLLARHRKLHPFISPYLTAGNTYTVFELFGLRCGILICYDNNIVENVRATALLGADLIFMPHVTMCTPSKRPGAGYVDPALWKNRKRDPETLRREFDGPKGREWLLRWLPSRAHDNGVYVVFTNPVGMDDDQLKNGCSMILDPFGGIMAECRKPDNDMVIAAIDPSLQKEAGGRRYRNARRPELYRDIIGKSHRSVQKVAWLKKS